jgi:hypothetical protein
MAWNLDPALEEYYRTHPEAFPGATEQPFEGTENAYPELGVERPPADNPLDTGEPIDVSDPVKYIPPGKDSTPEEHAIASLLGSPGASPKASSTKEEKGRVLFDPGSVVEGKALAAPEKESPRGDAFDSILGQGLDEALRGLHELPEESVPEDAMMEEAKALVSKPIEKKSGKNVAKKVVKNISVKEKGKPEKEVTAVTESPYDITKITPDTGAVDQTMEHLLMLTGLGGLVRSLGSGAAGAAIRGILDSIGKKEAPAVAESIGPEALAALKKLGEMLPKGRGIPPSPVGRIPRPASLSEYPGMGPGTFETPVIPPPAFTPKIAQLYSKYGKAARGGDSEGVKAIQKMLQKTIGDQKAYKANLP